MKSLTWLPEIPHWRDALKNASASPVGVKAALLELSNSNLDFTQTNSLDAVIGKLTRQQFGISNNSIRLAILGSCTLSQVHPAIRVAGFRRDLQVSIYESEYGQYLQELSDGSSGLHSFRPNVVLFALDGHHLASGVHAGMTAAEADAALDEVLSRIRTCWQLARDVFACPIIHQTPLPVHEPLLGNNEHRLAGSKAAFIDRLIQSLRSLADEAGVDLLDLNRQVIRVSLSAWHDYGLWHRAKQEISPAAAPMYGELVARLIGAKLGRSYKCLVMDLDNTLWGGVIGDDGLESIVLGQGSALGEAFVAFQEYARELSHRGIILAVCSKNDEANALEPFDKHPEMILKRGDVACFVANWSDKAANIRSIAEQLNIGLDSLVFIDDNPFERTLVRQELPMVAVPEVGDDPTQFPRILSDAGYFEGLTVTQEDRERGGQYQGNRLREALKASATNLPAYLRSLEMELTWRRFDKMGLARTVQLINKTNQFNLTTKRYTEDDVVSVMRDNRAFGLQLRLVDRFGDNGIISIIVGKMENNTDCRIDTWLMSCRVLGRQVEQTTLNLVVAQARQIGAQCLIGEYSPTAKNRMVRDHYTKLGFTLIREDESGATQARLDLCTFAPVDTFIQVREG